jgi:hypothetical protein
MIMDKFVLTLKNASTWIYKNPIKFFGPIIIGIIILLINELLGLNMNLFLLIILSFIETNIILFNSSFYILKYNRIYVNKIIIIKIILCSVFNLCIFGVLEYFKLAYNLNVIILYLTKNIIYIIISIVLLLLIDKQIHLRDIFKNIFGIILILFIGISFSIISYIVFEKYLQYNISQEAFIRLIKSTQFVITNTYIFILIVYLNKNEEKN